jgi:Zn-dependent M28 family amino/carboxypeptidase
MKNWYLFFLLGLFACSSEPNLDKLIDHNQIGNDILVLASDSLMGRAPMSVGEQRTLAYLEQRMRSIGLEPAFGDSYLQEVPLAEITSAVPKQIEISNGKAKLQITEGVDFTLWSPLLKEEFTLSQSELVFAGFGIDAPDYNWNDFEGIDLTGKTVVVLVNDPGFHTGNDELFNGNAMTFYGRWPYKFDVANRFGAAGCIIVHEEAAAGYPWSVVDRSGNNTEYYLNNEALTTNVCGANGWITLETANKLFGFCGLNYQEMKRKATAPGFKPVQMGARFSTTIRNTWVEASSYNVGGVIRGSERPEEALVYTAHWDHLGIGVPVDGDSIYNGASDNAAAIAWMLAIADGFKQLSSPPERSILFLSPTAEEAGLIGSQHYVNNPVFEHSKTAACFNSDVIMFLGRFKDVTVTGLGHSELDDYLAEEATKQGRYIAEDPNPENGMFFRSDQLPFLRAGVPALFAKGYTHQVEMGKEETLKAVEEYWKVTYHKPSDHYIPKIHNLDGLVEDTKLFFRLGNRLANESYFPKWGRGSEFYEER